MKSTLLYAVILSCCVQPALAQIESDEQWQQEAAKQMHIQMPKQPATIPVQAAPKLGPKLQQAPKRQIGGYPMPVRHNSYGGYGYRPSRSSVRSGFGYRPQRSQLMPAGYSQEMLQQKILHLQQMQQQMSGGAGAPQQQQQQSPNMLQLLMGGGPQQPPQQQQQKPNMLQMLMGGGTQQLPQQQQQKPNMLQMLMGGGTQQLPQQQQQQQQGQGQFNRSELLKNFFGGDGSNSEQTGE